MNSMTKSFAALIAGVLIIGGCSVKKPEMPKVGQKVFPDEDFYIIRALLSENDNNLSAAVNEYAFLYEKTKKDVYFEKMIEDLFYQKDYTGVLDLSSGYLKKRFNKRVFMYRVLSYVELGETQKAKKELLEKMNKKDEFFYRMMAFIYIKEKNYEKASEYLKSLYALNHDKQTLLQLVDVLIKLKKYNEALAYLRTHLDMYGCEFDVCLRLAIIYKQTYDYDNLATIYAKMGKFNQKYTMFALRLYLDNNEYDKALKLINDNNLGDEYRLIVYEAKGDYAKAAYYAYKLYEKSANLKYLIKYCSYKYEASADKKTAKEIIPKLEYVIKFYPTPYLYNFLGYLLIKYDIDVKKGLEYVQKAVIAHPDNEEYIDSLAWGYYKLGECSQAWEIIKNVTLKDKEIKYHKQKIKECLEKMSQKGKKDDTR